MDLEYEGMDLYGRFVFKRGAERFLAEGHNVPSKFTPGRGDTVPGLVCMPYSVAIGPRTVAMIGWEESLVDYFYPLDWMRERGVATHEHVWIRRWRDAAQKLEDVYCSDCFGVSISTGQGRRVHWVQGPNWVMPVLPSVYNSTSGGPKVFCPSYLAFTPNFKAIVDACHSPAGGFPSAIPLRYKAQFVENNTQALREINICLYGFLYPPKLHHQMWKHVLSCSPSSRLYTPPERTRWEFFFQWLDVKFPFPSNPDEVFKDCREKPAGNACDCPSLNHFYEVHMKLKKCVEAIHHALVTFWEVSSIKNIRLKPMPLGVAEVNLVAIEKIDNFCSWLALWGWSYDWQEQTPTLIFTTSTFYLPQNCFPRRFRIAPSPGIIDGEIRYVQRSS